MHAFREAHRKGDWAAAPLDPNMSGEGAARRSGWRGISEADLREQLLHDIRTLFETVGLEAVVPLDDFPHVRQSIVNFGLADLSALREADLASAAVAARVREALLAHEPRLIGSELAVEIEAVAEGAGRRLQVRVTGEIAAEPVDLALDVRAELDLGAGKLRPRDLGLRA